MTAIRRFVLAQPLFETHTHQNRFEHHPWDRMGFHSLLMYATADLSTSSGLSFGEDEVPDADTVFEHWPNMRNTGYGQGTEMACREITGLAFTRRNAPAVSKRIQALIRRHGPQGIYRQMYRKANIRWSINDSCWHYITPINVIAGEQALDLMRHALRLDAVLVPRTRDDLNRIGKELGASIQTLADLDRALERYTRKAHSTGRLAAIKFGVAYLRDLSFADAGFREAAAAFTAIRRGRSADLKPLHDYLFHSMVRRAAALNVPVQIHTGYLAGNWGDFRRSDPGMLIPVLARYRDVRFDLFHAGWPFCSTMAAIGKAFPNVWLDMCWMWALSPVEAERVLDEWLGAVPANKILGFGADTGTPFGMVGYAMQARLGIARVLERRLARGDCDLPAARDVARGLLYRHACALYGMQLPAER